MVFCLLAQGQNLWAFVSLTFLAFGCQALGESSPLNVTQASHWSVSAFIQNLGCVVQSRDGLLADFLASTLSFFGLFSLFLQQNKSNNQPVNKTNTTSLVALSCLYDDLLASH